MHHDHLYKEVYLHCTKHCIHDHPYTKPSFPCKNKQKKLSHFHDFHVFPTISCVFLINVITHSSNPVFFIFLLFRQAVTKSQSTGQLLDYSSKLSVRQAVHSPQSVSQITALQDGLSSSSSKASQCLQKFIEMNASQWKTCRRRNLGFLCNLVD